MYLNQSYTTQSMQRKYIHHCMVIWKMYCWIDILFGFVACRQDFWDCINQIDIQTKLLICYALDYIVLSSESWVIHIEKTQKWR